MIKVFAAVLVLTASLAAVSSAQARGGCGWGAHRGPYGGCRANGAGPVVVGPARAVVVAPGRAVVVAPGAVVEPGRACPYGYHLGPQGRRCWPN
jgi:hypothetical protein